MLRRPVSWAQELIRFVYLHRASARACVRRYERASRSDVPDRVVVSLTTIPDRIDRIRPTLNSLLDQTRRPDAIYLNLPNESRREGRGYELPAFLTEYGPVHVIDCGEDMGPATKLLPTLAREKEPDTRIVVTDDDQIYPRNMIETLVDWNQKLPEAVVCARGFCVPAGFRIHARNTQLGENLGQPEPIEIIQGSGSYLVRSRYFSEDVFDYSAAPKEAFFQDDIWFSAHLARRGIERFVVPFDNCYTRIASWSARNTVSLWGGENRDGRVDETMLSYFQDAWRLVDGR
ncbi:MAG: glycosyltransferase family 2 protein [Deltaproteobacteria bacterium]|nr:glycosyltransferase family 2 protein [Deltaproteobacteria bacterium]MBW2697257.1 glycosyltransferase family 2 protein [Deltaproteobacteria bacterium]